MSESLEFSRGRLFEFMRIKTERPVDPIYWDGHEERELRELAEGKTERCMQPNIVTIGPPTLYRWPSMSIGPCQLQKGHKGEHKF
jgi:hypothetical protein